MLIEDFLVLDGWKEPHWGLNSNDSAIELALVLVGSGHASLIMEMINFQLEKREHDEG